MALVECVVLGLPQLECVRGVIDVVGLMADETAGEPKCVAIGLLVVVDNISVVVVIVESGAEGAGDDDDVVTAEHVLEDLFADLGW